MTKRRKIGVILTLIGICASVFTGVKFQSYYNIANSQFPPIEWAWMKIFDWMIPFAISLVVLFWGILALCTTDTYWEWLMGGK